MDKVKKAQEPGLGVQCALAVVTGLAVGRAMCHAQRHGKRKPNKHPATRVVVSGLIGAAVFSGLKHVMGLTG